MSLKIPIGVVRILFLMGLSAFACAEIDTSPVAAFNGTWVINEELSDDPDKQVERAIKKGGGKVPRGKKTKGRYRGGPPTQKLYDHLSYDEEFSFHYEEPEFRFSYDQGLERVFYSDGRRRVVSTESLTHRTDYSFGGWEDGVLYVESKPMDAGYIMETYTLVSGGNQLRVELLLEPSTFSAPIKIRRIFDRKPEEPTAD
jgi:hypothetical protein